jgi:hypothetical protein
VTDIRDMIMRALGAVPAVSGVPGWAVAAIAAAALLALVKTANAAARTAGGIGRHADDLGTVVVAGLATGVSANGMWRFFGDVLHIHGPGRGVAFAFLEIILVVSGIRARRVVRERIAQIKRDQRDDGAGVNIHQVMVWTVAGLSGVLSALDTPQFGGKLMRLAAPLLAAVMWEIGQWSDLAAARREAGLGRTRRTIAWRASPQRILVWLRLADPTARDAEDVDQTRRITALARAAYRAHTAPVGSWRRRVAEWRLRRLAFAAIDHADLGADERVARGVQVRLAASYQLLDGTSASAVGGLRPWHAGAGPTPAVEDGVDPHGGDWRAILAAWAQVLRPEPGPSTPVAGPAVAAPSEATPAPPTATPAPKPRAARATGTRRGPRTRRVPAGQGPDILLPVAREVARDLTAHGQSLTRDALRDGIRGRGMTCANHRAGELLTAVRGETNRKGKAS